MFQSLDFVVLGCFLLTVETIPGQISPPQNLSLWWLDDFQPQLTWHPVSNCTYTVTSKTSEEYSLKEESQILPPWKGEMVIEGGFVNLSVKTVCGEQESLPEALSVDYPVVVKNLQCYLYTSKEANCTWELDNSVSSSKFFYRLTIEDLSRPSRNSSFLPRLQECSNYLHTSSLHPDITTGCSLQANISNGIIILFNGTANSTFFRNAFKKYLKEDVRPPALNWTVIKTGGKFHISWTRPDIDLLWTYKLNYTECNKHLERDELNHASMQLDVIPHCTYCMTITAKSNKGSTPLSDKKCFDAETDHAALVYAAVIIPLMFAGLAALTFVCCKRNKEHIFPKVPQPRDLLSDISDNNNKSNVYNLYIPAEEEENCKITLLMDPQINKPGC